jgi:hypothetical protein
MKLINNGGKEKFRGLPSEARNVASVLIKLFLKV